MNSNDNISMSELKLLLDAHFARTDKQLADFRKDFAEFREQIKDDMNSFKQEIRAEIASFKQEINTEVRVLQLDIIGLKHDVANLQTWNYWTLSIILALIAMPQIVAGIKALFAAVSEGVSGVLALFRKENKKS